MQVNNTNTQRQPLPPGQQSTLPMRVVAFEEGRPSTPISWGTTWNSSTSGNINLVFWLQNPHQHEIRAAIGIVTKNGVIASTRANLDHDTAQEVLRCAVPLTNSPITRLAANVLAGCTDRSCPLHRCHRGRFELNISYQESSSETKELEPK